MRITWYVIVSNPLPWLLVSNQLHNLWGPVQNENVGPQLRSRKQAPLLTSQRCNPWQMEDFQGIKALLLDTLGTWLPAGKRVLLGNSLNKQWSNPESPGACAWAISFSALLRPTAFTRPQQNGRLPQPFKLISVPYKEEKTPGRKDSKGWEEARPHSHEPNTCSKCPLRVHLQNPN